MGSTRTRRRAVPSGGGQYAGAAHRIMPASARTVPEVSAAVCHRAHRATQFVLPCNTPSRRRRGTTRALKPYGSACTRRIRLIGAPAPSRTIPSESPLQARVSAPDADAITHEAGLPATPGADRRCWPEQRAQLARPRADESARRRPRAPHAAARSALSLPLHTPALSPASTIALPTPEKSCVVNSSRANSHGGSRVSDAGGRCMRVF